ncbi:hypothetical protein [Streptomyces meridianus]|uniref:Uncharacterized protein n=1 Tax=Streptomyces meridianus TaxID=2938945 RepID=A0ABT0XCQ9_9ACTN|nr:hypothetical protein [Streptomyces meridianus]MCM2580315.1 hypothetical protein [Streptomyces meridianus]
MMQQHHGDQAESAAGIPRDMPDQQAGATDDHDRDQEATGPEAHEDVPGTDEAGTGRRGERDAPGVGPGQPVPDEPAD